jgi:AraC-like DNA-binding protein
LAERLEKLEVRLDGKELKEAYFETPVVSQEKLKSVTTLLSIFADHLSVRSNQIAVQQANGEPPVIARAKQFILEHYKERLSLAHVAGVVHTNIFSLCKLFRKVTGITFTEFVSRARVERAKNLLLNPNSRVSEVAFEAGFRSLTHFNRSFKTLVGESPTDYRGHLPRLPLGARSARNGAGASPFEQPRLVPVAPPVRPRLWPLFPAYSRLPKARIGCAPPAD